MSQVEEILPEHSDECLVKQPPPPSPPEEPHSGMQEGPASSLVTSWEKPCEADTTGARLGALPQDQLSDLEQDLFRRPLPEGGTRRFVAD